MGLFQVHLLVNYNYCLLLCSFLKEGIINSKVCKFRQSTDVSFSNSCVNPTLLIASLGIDTTTQQDAQEFSKLFLNLLEEKLSLQTDPEVSTMVPNQFRGEYEYVTR